MNEARLQQAVRCLQQGQPDQARSLCEEIVRGEPGHGMAWGLLGSMAMDRGDLPRAVESWQRSLQSQPKQPSTTSDILRAGVPVLTCAGEAFASRPRSRTFVIHIADMTTSAGRASGSDFNFP